MTVREIVTNYLKENGFDGLFQSEVSCGCTLDDLAPCDGDPSDCEPCYTKKCDWSNCSNTSCDAHGDKNPGLCFTTEKPDAPAGETENRG